MRVLLDQAGVDLCCRDSLGVTPLMLACRHKPASVLDVLERDGRAFAGATREDLSACLGSLAFTENLEVMRHLIHDLGVDPNSGDQRGVTPLHHACGHGPLKMVDLLLREYGVDVNASDKEGDTPLHDACRWRHVELVRRLLDESGVDVNRRNALGMSPFHEACSVGRRVIMESLVRAGAELNDDLLLEGMKPKPYSPYYHRGPRPFVVSEDVIRPLLLHPWFHRCAEVDVRYLPDALKVEIRPFGSLVAWRRHHMRVDLRLLLLSWRGAVMEARHAIV
jgi:ankyrin repeat protein